MFTFRTAMLRSRVVHTLNTTRIAARQYSSTAVSTQSTVARSVVGTTAAAGIIGLCVLGPKASDNSQDWQPYVSQRVSSTYMWFSSGLALTASSAFMLARSQTFVNAMVRNPMVFSLGGLAVTIGSMMATRTIPYESPAKMPMWGLFNASVAASFVPVAFMAGPVVMRAAVYTGAVVGGLSLIALSAKSDQFLSWGQPLGLCLGAICITSIGRIFLPARFFITHSVLDNVFVYGGMLVFSGLVMYDTQKIVHKAKVVQKFDPINESLHIYLDTINLFRIILSMTSNRK